jgi:PEGA domain
VGAENQKPPMNPLDELKNLDRQVDLVSEVADLKAIFVRLDAIARENSDDFEVQLIVGDIKQHLVNRGTRLKELKAAGPPPIPGPAAAPPVQPAQPQAPRDARMEPTVRIPPRVPPPPIPGPAAPPPAPTNTGMPTVRLMSSGQFTRPGDLKPPPVPESRAPEKTPPVSSTQAPRPPVIPPSQEPTVRLTPGVTPGPTRTGQQTPVAPGTGPAFQGGPAIPPRQPPAQPPTQPPRRPTPPAQEPSHWKRSLLIGALIGAVATIAILVLVVNQARKHFKLRETATIDVNFTTSPPQAAIRVNGDPKCTSPCTARLAPGTYQVTAFLDGYDPVTGSVNVVAGQPAGVTLALNPLPGSVRILTDLDQGKITLDDLPPMDLQEGQYTVDKIAPGPHTVKLTARNGEAAFSFLIAEAKPPEITGTVTARNLIAVLVSSVGSQARVFTNSGPLKLAVNGQPEGDAGPAGIDLKNFHPGPDEIIVGDGKDQRNFNESFTPAPTLTAFFKSDLNIGTLIVSTGEDDVKVFVNGKEYRRHTQNGQVRIPAIGQVAVRVAKDGFEFAPAQTVEVKKGSEVRLEFKMKALPQTSTLQIHGATPGAEVVLDQNSIGTVGADGNFTSSTIPAGDHTIDLRRDQFTPKRLARSFKAGQTTVISGADAVLAAAATTGTIRLNRTPADASITYRRADETQTHEVRGPQIDLPAGAYVFSAHAQGYSERLEHVQIAAGETRTIEFTLARAAPVLKPGTMADFEDPAAWRKEGELWTHRGGGFIPYKLGPRGVYTFTVELVHGGNVFKGGRIRWAVEYVDSKNYLLYELNDKNFWADVVENGKKLERAKTQHDLEKQKAFTIQIELTAEHCVHRIRSTNGQWMVLDSFSEPGRDFTKGKFGFLIQGNDEIGVSEFSFTPK